MMGTLNRTQEMSLSFLNNIEVAAAAVRTRTEKAVGSPRVKLQRQPDTADLRIWKDGSIYPSDALVAEFDLEYQNKDAEKRGVGFDVAAAADMPNQITSPENFLVIGAVPREEGKLDVFATCTWDENNVPMKKVAEQGATSYGKATLLPLLKEVYGVEPNEIGYIDLSFVRSTPIVSPNGIFLVPKALVRGENAGKVVTERRENITLYPLVPTAQLEQSANEQPTEGAVQDPNQMEIPFPRQDQAVSTTTSATEGTTEGTELQVDGSLEIGGTERAEPIDYSSSEYDEAAALTSNQGDPFTDDNLN